MTPVVGMDSSLVQDLVPRMPYSETMMVGITRKNKTGGNRNPKDKDYAEIIDDG